MIRHNSLKGTKSDVAPILWQHGAFARLKPGELIDKLLFNNYSTISLGYAGLYECVKYMTGHSHTEEGGYDFGIEIMQYLTDTCAKWRKETNISFSLYGTPIEATTFKFAKCLQKRFGIIEGITDKKYVTNSYHVTPSEPIDAFSKLDIESKFQELSAGGENNVTFCATSKYVNHLPNGCAYYGANGGSRITIMPCQAYQNDMEGVQTKCRGDIGTPRSAYGVKQSITCYAKR